MWQTRREILKMSGAGAAGLVISSLDLGLPDSAAAAIMKPPGGWSGSPGQARYRIDGVAKVTGQKIYARDFRPADLPHWPTRYHHALVVRATFIDHIYDGLDLEQLPAELQPLQTITAVELARDRIGITEEDYPAGDYLLPPGSQPSYLGQAIAILIYDDAAAYEGAKEQIVFNRKAVRMGKKVAPKDPTYFQPETSIIHVVDEKGDEKFSQTIQGPVHPEQPGADNEQAMEYVDFIGARLNSNFVDVYKQSYETPVVDPMFMEPESGLAWFDRKAKTLRLLIGTQSPGYDVNSSRALFAPDDCAIDIDDVHLYAAYPGGGFGGRDTSILCVFLALAAAYSDHPIRIAHDRFQQFQSGVKRHTSRIELTIGVNDKDSFEVIRNHSVLDGGGRRNVSTYVADVNGVTGAGAYRFPLADIWTRPQHTQSQVAGSMRGKVTNQRFFYNEFARNDERLAGIRLQYEQLITDWASENRQFDGRTNQKIPLHTLVEIRSLRSLLHYYFPAEYPDPTGRKDD
ncbi:MAG: molybdopterin cofactor-binding domain-containing protein [Pseudomonadota bacterium]